MEVRVQRHAPSAYPREKTGTHCEGDYVGSRPGLNMCGKLAPTGIRSASHPARSGWL